MMAKGSKCRWGNSIGYVLIPLWIKAEDNILEYVRQAKTTMDRKKHSLEPLFFYRLLKVTVEAFGILVKYKILIVPNLIYMYIEHLFYSTYISTCVENRHSKPLYREFLVRQRWYSQMLLAQRKKLAFSAITYLTLLQMSRVHHRYDPIPVYRFINFNAYFIMWLIRFKVFNSFLK